MFINVYNIDQFWFFNIKWFTRRLIRHFYLIKAHVDFIWILLKLKSMNLLFQDKKAVNIVDEDDSYHRVVNETYEGGQSDPDPVV